MDSVSDQKLALIREKTEAHRATILIWEKLIRDGHREDDNPAFIGLKTMLDHWKEIEEILESQL